MEQLMDNIYKSPESNLDNGNGVFKRSIWWKVYFYIITLLSLIGMISYLVSDGAGFVDYIEALILLVSTIGLFGFVFNKKILFPGFWFSVLIINFLFGFAYEFLSNVDMRQGMSDFEYYIAYAVGVVICLPSYWALYSYSKATNQPWASA